MTTPEMNTVFKKSLRFSLKVCLLIITPLIKSVDNINLTYTEGFMTFVKLKGNRVKVSLDRNEAERLFGSADRIDQNSPATRHVLKILFMRAAQKSFSADCKTVMIEMTKNLTGGWDIYFIKSAPVKQREGVAVFVFDSAEDAVRGAQAAVLQNQALPESRFLKSADGFLLELRSPQRDVRLALGEFCLSAYYTTLGAVGRELIGKNAIEVLSKL